MIVRSTTYRGGILLAGAVFFSSGAVNVPTVQAQARFTLPPRCD